MRSVFVLIERRGEAWREATSPRWSALRGFSQRAPSGLRSRRPRDADTSLHSVIRQQQVHHLVW